MSVFGALNRFIARLDEGADAQQHDSKRGAHGFQVLRNKNTELQIEPWFDFIIGINGRSIDNPDPNLFGTEVRNCAGHTISLGVWSAKGQRIREMYVAVPADQQGLGLSLQWTALTATDDVWHILDVTPNSPADVAGLLPYGDYVIGSPEGLVRGESGLPELVEDFLERPLRLLVYNHEYGITRPVTITPSRGWGGQGALGCVLGYGALHRIPAPLDEPPQAPGEALFDAQVDEKAPLRAMEDTQPQQLNHTPSGDFLIPANLEVTPKAGSPGPPTGGGGKPKKGRAHHAISPTGGLDEYFAEGEKKSKENDYAPSSKAGAVPPPPRGDGPPKTTPATATATEESTHEDDVD